MFWFDVTVVYSQREKSPESIEPQLPNVELSGNPSSFTVYSVVRQAALEQSIKDAACIYHQATKPPGSDSECEEELEEKSKEPSIKIPKVV